MHRFNIEIRIGGSDWKLISHHNFIGKLKQIKQALLRQPQVTCQFGHIETFAFSEVLALKKL